MSGTRTQRIAIVTGAASGIGAATARALATDGWRVAVADLDVVAATAVAREIDGLPVEVDVGVPSAVVEMATRVLAELGAIDLLVNNAGWDCIAPFIDTDPDLWDRILSVNLKGQIACAHAVLPHMLERRRGRIICVASDAGRVGSSGEVVYSAAKGGVIAFSKALAREVARDGVLVNAVAPGPTRTPFLDRFSEGGSTRIVDAMVKATPLRRLADPADVADAIAFFASERARFITGQTLSVSGGLTMA